MKSILQKQKPLNSRAAKIMKSLRDARKSAIKTARLHGTAIVYMQDGRLVRERP